MLELKHYFWKHKIPDKSARPFYKAGRFQINKQL